MKHIPTEEQQAIIDFARTRSENLLVNALAGTAKTSTLEMICHALPTIPILSLAFNKRIADEMKKHLPSHVECKTMNALGHSVWARATGRRLIVDADKSRTILKNVIGELPKGQQGEAWGYLADTLLWIARAKREGLVPHTWGGPSQKLITWDEFCDKYGEEPTDQQAYLLAEVLRRSIIASYEGGIDFDDQIYMPVIFGGTWPRFPLVLIDEFQDLNELQHEMLSKLVVKRLIGVGDPWQSIYAFRGAKQNGMKAAKERWQMEELTLSATFRVPRKGVERAWFRVPHMRWRDQAPEGQIDTFSTWRSADVPDNAAIICRNNAPLLRCGFRLLRSGRPIKLVGFDIGAGLVRILRKLGPEMAENLEELIEGWETREAKRARRPETVYDRADCLRALCEGRKNLAAAVAHAEAIFKQNGTIQLLSGHKAKGLEWETVFHLDPWRIPHYKVEEGTEAWEQEMNVRYVIETRFKERLVLVDLEGWRE